MNRKQPKWELYERLVARVVSDQLSTSYCVTPNARVRGKISGLHRQIDVLIDFRHNTDNRRRIIIDAKARARPIDVTHVEAFRGLMEDVEATHGYLVCPNGHTPAAERRAQDGIAIRLLLLDRLEDFDPSSWPLCLASRCRDGRIFWDGYPCVDMSLIPAQGGDKRARHPAFVHYVGKCDRCSRFHVKCMTCGEMFSLDHESDDAGVACKCAMPWFWLASVEHDEEGRPSAELHLILGTDRIETVDRRSL